jgi:putative aldouronate transport system permease protein
MERSRGFIYEFKKNKVLFIMAVPSVLFFVIFCYLPMAGVYMAFTQYNMFGGIFNSPFVGLDNFRFLVLSGQLFDITRNTILYNVVFQIFGSAAQIIAAIFISEIPGKYFKKFTQSIMFLPYFVSFVLIGTFVYQIFNFEYGTLNNVLKTFGFQPIDVYANVGIWKYIIVFFFIWKNIGYGMVIYLATIMGISSEYYEAAKIDGADIFKQIRYITLPLLKPTFIILSLFALGNILRGQFQLFYQIIGNNGNLFSSTDIIDTFVFRSLINSPNYGLITAAGLYQSFFGFLLIVLVNFTVKKVNPEYALF